jgi:hypothetical protein
VVTPNRHGGTVELRPEALLAEDPELELVWADMDAWFEAHPCSCPDICHCETDEDEDE